jgi:hypothetical protein
MLHGEDFLLGGLDQPRWPKLGGNEHPAERAEQVGDRRGVLGLIPGRGGAAGSDVDGGLAIQRVPHHGQRQAHQAEGDGALDRQ